MILILFEYSDQDVLAALPNCCNAVLTHHHWAISSCALMSCHGFPLLILFLYLVLTESHHFVFEVSECSISNFRQPKAQSSSSRMIYSRFEIKVKFTKTSSTSLFNQVYLNQITKCNDGRTGGSWRYINCKQNGYIVRTIVSNIPVVCVC